MSHWHGITALCYPQAEATHEQVVADRALFQRTLESLHGHLGIKLKIPKVGGVEVDLHLLYREVTGLHGLESVINRKQWVIVCEPFNFPASFTNKSFVIKKLYVNALHHYEQLYFHGRQGPLVPAPIGSSDLPAASERCAPAKRKAEPQSESGGLMQSVTVVPAGDSSKSGSPITGIQDGTKFTGSIDRSVEQGYMITIQLPGQRLQGMLYGHAQPNLLPGGAAAQQHGRACGDDTAISREEGAQHGSACKRTKKPARQEPRPIRSPFQYFQMGVKQDQILPSEQAAFELWQHLSPEQQQPFRSLSEADVVRFEKEYREYRIKQVEVEAQAEEAKADAAAHLMTPQAQRSMSAAAGSQRAPPPPHYSHPRSMRLQYPPPHPQQQQQQQPHPSVPHFGLPQMVRPVGMGMHPPPHHAMSHFSAEMQRRGLGNAPGLGLLPPDIEPDDVSHLCHYNEDVKQQQQQQRQQQRQQQMQQQMQQQGLPFGSHEHGEDGQPGPHEEDHEEALQQQDHEEAMDLSACMRGNGLDDQDPFAVSLSELHGHDQAAAAACADIDLFGCSAELQVTSAAMVVKAEPKRYSMAGATSPADAAHLKGPLRRLSGQEGASSAGSPCDVHVSPQYHGMPVFGAEASHLPTYPAPPAHYQAQGHHGSHYEYMGDLFDDVDHPIGGHHPLPQF